MKSSAATYGVTLVAVILVWLARSRLDQLLGDHLPFATFCVALIVAAWVGGLRPALLATELGFFLSLFYFQPPRLSFAIPAQQRAEFFAKRSPSIAKHLGFRVNDPALNLGSVP